MWSTISLLQSGYEGMTCEDDLLPQRTSPAPPPTLLGRPTSVRNWPPPGPGDHPGCALVAPPAQTGLAPGDSTPDESWDEVTTPSTV